MSAKKWTILLAALLILSPMISFANWWKAPGAVYTMSNDPVENTVIVFERSATGKLTLSEEIPTGGLGTGGGLGNQGGLVLSRGDRRLFVVNAGSNTITVFEVEQDGLEFVEQVNSGGEMPVSLAVDRRLLYVLNAGGVNNITGFRIGRYGNLTPIPGSTRPLSRDSVGPAQVGFSPDGDVLVVTEKATDRIDVYSVGTDGIANGPVVYDSEGQTPFGFAFGKRNQLIVSEAAGAMPDASSASSYRILRGDTLKVISSAEPTNQTAACWVVITNGGRFAYTTNAAGDSISGFRIGFLGRLYLLDEDGRTGETGPGSGPIDMALSNNGKFLYTLNGGNGTITGFWIKWNGRLIPLPSATVDGLPAGANGLAAR